MNVLPLLSLLAESDAPRTAWAPVVLLLVIGIGFAAGNIVLSVIIGPSRTGPGSAAIPTAASCPAVHAGSGAAAPGSAPHATIPDPGPGSSSSRPPASFQIAGIAITSARPASASRAGRFRRAPRRGAGRGPAQDRRRRPGMT